MYWCLFEKKIILFFTISIMIFHGSLNSQNFECDIENSSRGADKVVAAKDDTKGLFGGTKEISLSINEAVTVTAERFKGSEGSCEIEVFNSVTNTSVGIILSSVSPNSNKISLLFDPFSSDNTFRIVIRGRDVSDEPRNMRVLIENAIGAQKGWEFTVFMVETEAFISGNVEDVVPESVILNAGFGPNTMITGLTINGPDILGHQYFSDPANNIDPYIQAGIAFRGKIIPSGMNKEDFNSDYSRVEAFNWYRVRFERDYNSNDCLNVPDPKASYLIADEMTDDLNDHAEDLIPDYDINTMPDDLFIWDYDRPSTRIVLIPNNGDIMRTRINFIQGLYYGDVKIAEDIEWSWAVSIENDNNILIQNNDIVGDNQVQIGLIELTPNLNNSLTPTITINSSTPPEITYGNSKDGTVTGSNLSVNSSNCEPLAYLIRTIPTTVNVDNGFPLEAHQVSIYPLLNISFTETEIEGTYDTFSSSGYAGYPDPSFPSGELLGDYEVKVFYNSQQAVSPDITEIK